MKSLLLEIYTEEIPALELEKAGTFFKNTLEKYLKDNELPFQPGKLYLTPRRIAYRSEGVTEKQADRTEEVFGPYKQYALDQDGKPTKALLGFLKSKKRDLDSISFKADSKGERVYFKEERIGATLESLLQPFFNKHLMPKFPFKKSMRWGTRNYSFSRPVYNLLAILGGEVLDISYHDLIANNKTFGHSILHFEPIVITDDADYERLLREQKVVADMEIRQEMIATEIKKIDAAHDFQSDLDPRLLKEVANLVEYPVPFLGTFSADYLELPQELLISSMKKHQKYFPVYQDGVLANYFIGVANIPMDSKKAIIAGNQRVLKARLDDAQFFFSEDLKRGLEPLLPRLDKVLFQKDLGSYGDKIRRIKATALELNQRLEFNLSTERVAQGADLIKVDLVTGMVNEFAELQGVAGFYYATKLGYSQEIALAIKEHYQPKTVNDPVPESKLSLLLALSDKLDTLVGGFLAGLAPTGSKDPFALRRAALSLLKILTELKEPLPIDTYIDVALNSFKLTGDVKGNLIIFFKDRLKNFLRGDYAADIVAAITDRSNIINASTLKLCQAMKNFKADPDANQLVFLMKRITNILKKDLGKLSGEVNEALLKENAEKVVYQWILDHRKDYFTAIKEEAFEDALKIALTAFEPLDQFFLDVMVNDDDLALRQNRQLMLQTLFTLLNEIAALDQLVVKK